MAVKVVFLLVLVALAFGLPASNSNLDSSSDAALVNEVSASVSEYFEKLFGEKPTDIMLKNEPGRVKRGIWMPILNKKSTYPPRNVCHPVVYHGPAGMNLTIWDCVERKTLEVY